MTKNNLNANVVAMTFAWLTALVVCCQFDDVQGATLTSGASYAANDSKDTFADYGINYTAIFHDGLEEIIDDDEEEEEAVEDAVMFLNAMEREFAKMMNSDDVESVFGLQLVMIKTVELADDESVADNIAYACDRIIKEALKRTVSRVLMRYDWEDIQQSRKIVRFVAETLSQEIVKGLQKVFENYVSNKPRISDSDCNVYFIKGALQGLFAAEVDEDDLRVTSKNVSMLEHEMIITTLALLLIVDAADDDIDVEEQNLVSMVFDQVVKSVCMEYMSNNK